MTVEYTSTRNPSVRVDFPAAVLSGQPADGGLYIPTSIPARPELGLEADDSVSDLARLILPEWIGSRIADMLDFERIFSFPIVERTLEGDGDVAGLRIVELFHGPTGSFKDFGARFLAACLSGLRGEQSKPALVVVATSGDTGSAVADAFSGLPGIGVVILFPSRGVSAVQRSQLTAPRDGVWALAVEGSFDDCQRGAKSVLAEGVAGADVLSANSINIGRLLPQMLFYLGRSASDGDGPEYVVPSGNLGNLTAGLLARAAYRPMARFHAATNSNDYFARVLAEPGAAPAELRTTLSNAMDVAHPSNLERIDTLFDSRLGDFLRADSVDDAATREAMRRVYAGTGYLVDPHTAVGIEVAVRARRRAGRSAPGTYSVIATADPAKFPEVVEEETGVDLSGGRFSPHSSPPARVIRPDEISDAVVWVASNLH